MKTFLSNSLERIQNIKFGIIPRVITLVVLFYLIGLPLYPELSYDLAPPKIENTVKTIYAGNGGNDRPAASSTPLIQPSATASSGQIQAKYSTQKGDRIIIEKIGVDAPIIVSKNGPAALNKGAWLMPQGSTPEFGSNTVITAHRFKYLPPNNLTFYLIDKLKPGDIITVVWKGITYNYEVRGSRRVTPKEVSILNPTAEPMLTIFSCDPVFSTKYRLVVTSKLLGS